MSPKKGITDSPTTYGAFRSAVNKAIYRSKAHAGKVAKDFAGGQPKALRQAYKDKRKPSEFVKEIVA